jgi:multicomponent K+:H+ antiporter subunit D
LLELDSAAAWALFVLLIAAGLLAAIAFMRAGMRHFWSGGARAAPRLRIVESIPVALLLLALLLLVVHGNAVLRYAQATADALHQPRLYIEAVRGTRPVPGAARGSP